MTDMQLLYTANESAADAHNRLQRLRRSAAPCGKAVLDDFLYNAAVVGVCRDVGVSDGDLVAALADMAISGKPRISAYWIVHAHVLDRGGDRDGADKSRACIPCR